jgi:hypothetical protein
MNDKVPLYSTRLTKNYLDYLGKHHPDVSIDSVLDYAGMTRYEVEDPAHWFNQKQMDDFHEILVRKTGVLNISREVGRYAASGGGFGAAKQLMIGLISPTAGYLLTEKYYPIISRGAVVKARKVGPTRVEIVSKPNPGVDEKPYQCENRTGTFESLARLFTDKLANVDHPECFHEGDSHCRYVITWKKTAALVWRRIRNYVLLLAGLCSLALLGFMSAETWCVAVLAFALLSAGVSYYAEYLEKKELTQTVETQKATAEDQILESNIRYNNALLVQEIGQAASKILTIDDLFRSVIKVMDKRLDFDRGMIMLADEEKSHLRYSAGFGHTKKQEKFLRGLEFNLNNPESKGLFILTMRERKPLLIQDIREIEDTLSPRSLEFAKQMGGRSAKRRKPLDRCGVTARDQHHECKVLCKTTTERKQISRTCRNRQQYYPEDSSGRSHYIFQ